MSLNKVQLIGNVGKDPEIRSTQDGREIANFSMATNQTWKNKDGTKGEKVEYHRIVVFSQGLVGIIKNYVKKGSKLYIEGQLQTRKWTDKDGVEKYTTEVVLQNYNSTLQMLDSKGKDSNENSNDEKMTPEYIDNLDRKNSEELDDDIPF